MFNCKDDDFNNLSMKLYIFKKAKIEYLHDEFLQFLDIITNAIYVTKNEAERIKRNLGAPKSKTSTTNNLQTIIEILNFINYHILNFPEIKYPVETYIKILHFLISLQLDNRITTESHHTYSLVS